MKQIWRIYKTDLRNVAKHWAAIVIVVGLMILPSLYAWFNIKASWDPYGNTKEVPIAVSNEDAGSNLRGKRYQYRERDCRFSEEKQKSWLEICR